MHIGEPAIWLYLPAYNSIHHEEYYPDEINKYFHIPQLLLGSATPPLCRHCTHDDRGQIDEYLDPDASTAACSIISRVVSENTRRRSRLWGPLLVPWLLQLVSEFWISLVSAFAPRYSSRPTILLWNDGTGFIRSSSVDNILHLLHSRVVGLFPESLCALYQ